MKRIPLLIFCLMVGTLNAGCDDKFDPLSFLSPEFDEGLNLVDVSGTVTLPAALGFSVDEYGTIITAAATETTETIYGALYIGFFSGTDDSNAQYPMPLTAPVSNDAFPYGGTTIGTFDAINPATGERDTELVCKYVSNQNFEADTDGNLVHNFDILQFPFYSGATLWAFLDVDTDDPENGTCSLSSGFRDPDDNTIYYGANFPDVLNKPQEYVSAGDVVTGFDDVIIMESLSDPLDITINCHIGVNC